MSQSFTRGVPIDPDPTLSNNSDLLVASQKATKTYVDNGLLTKQNVIGYTPVDKGGDTMIGNLILNADPTTGLQAATKQYVDNLVNGVDWKEAAHAATVAALPAYTVSGGGQVLTGVANGAIPTATTDGHAILVTERILVKDEAGANAPNNGIYVLTQVGSITQPFILTRSADANTPAYLLEATVSVINGSTLSNTIWHLTPAAVPIVIGTTDLTWIEISSGGITTLNTLTATTQTFATGTTGTDFNISSAISTHTFNLPDASAINRGALTSADWITFNNKGNGTVTSVATSSPITGGTITGSGTIGISDAKADSLTKGASTFKDSDFDDNGAGLISIDYTNGQSANTTTKGFLTSTDWNTFNGKQDLLVSGTNIKTVNGATLLGSGNLTTLGYTLSVQALTSSPVDAQTIYFGNLPKAPVTTANISKVYIPKAGTIKRAEIYCYSGTAGTNQAWSGYIRLNNTTDTLISTLSVATSERVFSNSALSIAVVAGDYFEIKFINPTWATNPLTTIFGGYIYIE
jgi:hypothetical protein